MRKIVVAVFVVPLLFLVTCTVSDQSPLLDMARGALDMAATARDAFADATGIDMAVARDASAAPPSVVMCKSWTRSMGQSLVRTYFAEIPAPDPRFGGAINAWVCDQVDINGNPTTPVWPSECPAGWTCDPPLGLSCFWGSPSYDAAAKVFRVYCGSYVVTNGIVGATSHGTRVYYTITP